MRVDFQQGQHLRVGRLCVSVQDQGLPHPFISGCSTVQHHIDEERAAKVYGEVERLLDDVAIDQVVKLDSGRMEEVIPLAALDRLHDAVIDMDVFGHDVERFGGLAFHIGERLWSVTWLGAGLPRSPRQRWRQLRWRLTRRPAVPVTPTPGAYVSRSAHPSSAT